MPTTGDGARGFALSVNELGGGLYNTCKIVSFSSGGLSPRKPAAEQRDVSRGAQRDGQPVRHFVAYWTRADPAGILGRPVSSRSLPMRRCLFLLLVLALAVPSAAEPPRPEKFSDDGFVRLDN